MLKTLLLSGFLFATAFATGKPNMATLEVLPNFDQGLTYKDFRVHYSGVGFDTEGSSVSIKIYRKDQYQTAFHTFKVANFDKPKAYYFGLNDTTAGDYEVDVCVGDDDSKCSGKNPALTSVEADHQAKKITCEKGEDNALQQYTKTGDIILDVIGAERWIEESDLNRIETALSTDKDPYQTEWTKNKKSIKSNPSYDRNEHRLYASVIFDIAEYRELFMKKDAPGRTGSVYAPDFCKRKYILSYHVHILETKTHEVVHRFKKTLHLSQGGKFYFIYQNDSLDKSTRPKIHVELNSTGDLKLDSEDGYQVWVSFCATEKDKNDSTICSNPLIGDLVIS